LRSTPLATLHLPTIALCLAGPALHDAAGCTPPVVCSLCTVCPSLPQVSSREYRASFSSWGRLTACSMRSVTQDRVIGPDFHQVCDAWHVQASGRFPQLLSAGAEETAEPSLHSEFLDPGHRGDRWFRDRQRNRQQRCRLPGLQLSRARSCESARLIMLVDVAA
jgi:hypothetical protein